MALELYKPEDATRSRGGIAVMLGSLVFYGIISLYEWLAGTMFSGDLANNLLGDEFPISWRVIICSAMIVGSALAIYMLCNHKRIVDFLILTEQEMQKVSWPPQHEIISSSIVVCMTVVILAIYLGLIDYGLVLFKDHIPWDTVWKQIF